jgi:hypothetical protein
MKPPVDAIRRPLRETAAVSNPETREHADTITVPRGGPGRSDDGIVSCCPQGAALNESLPTDPVRAHRPAESLPPGSRWRSAAEVPAPARPASLREAALTVGQLTDLVLKLLYLHGALTGFDISSELRLPFSVVEEGLRFLKEQRCAEVTSGEMLGVISQRFVLTDLGRIRARDAFEQSRYVGPAPVSLEAYTTQCRLQSVVDIRCTPDDLREAFAGLVIRAGLLEELGPAVCSGRSIFLHGPPGNGKSVIARGLGRFLNTRGGDIYVPYAVHVEGAIITVFDPAIHRVAESDDSFLPDGERRPAAPEATSGAPQHDLRWRKVRRPVVITGGELTLDMLDLRHNPNGHYYFAPPHVKANGGLFLIDDFGRQIVRPKELLNRWILPLEDRFDHLTLTTGRKVAVPFEQLIVFSTNLEPKSLVDEAFLRRIRHKILIGPPTREVFAEIFRQRCELFGIPFETSAVEYLYSRHYDRQRLPKACDPRDLLEIAGAVCRFRGERAHLAESVLAEAAQRLFCEV